MKTLVFIYLKKSRVGALAPSPPEINVRQWSDPAAVFFPPDLGGRCSIADLRDVHSLLPLDGSHGPDG